MGTLNRSHSPSDSVDVANARSEVPFPFLTSIEAKEVDDPPSKTPFGSKFCGVSKSLGPLEAAISLPLYDPP